MKRFAVILLILLAGLQHASATHYRAGVMTYQLIPGVPYTYIVTVTTYTTNIYVPPDRDTVTISWGDNSQSPAPRINGQGYQVGPNIKVNIYQATHTYSGPEPFYIISMNDPNRMDGILNIDNGNSVDVPFYIEDTLRFIDPQYSGYDNSPVMLNPPIDFGNVDDTFWHNPDGYDPDGDSLSYQLVPSLQGEGAQVPNYIFPDSVVPGIDDKITINPVTGLVIWATPKEPGPYNVAILIREYRQGKEIGTELYDMMIIVQQEQDHPPHIQAIHDTCVVAGADLKLLVTANDPDPEQIITLSANGGPFVDSTLLPNATFVPTSGIDTADGLFDWQTTCNEIREQSYQIVFNATDNAPFPLTDQVTWIITIIGPGPQNLQAKAAGSIVNLTWQNPYACDGSQTSHFIGFSVWRREGPNPFTPDTCNPGLAGYGYTEIDNLTTAYTYADSNVEIGKDYCYRIQAEFADTTAGGYYYNQVPSLPSNEACANLKINLPVITKVSIGNTDAQNGTDTVIWEKPFVGGANGLDTSEYPGPYAFVLYRSQGFNTAANPTVVDSITTPYLASFADTVFIDSGLNTTANPYSYYVKMYSNGAKLGSSVSASSVYLIARRNNQRIDLSWADSSAWVNNQFEIFKLNSVSGNFDSLATVDTAAYSDLNLINDSLYCYKVLTIGSFTVAGLHDPVLNLSQEACMRPHDTIPPCPPVLTVTNPCTGLNTDSSCSVGAEDLKNTLTWTRPNPDSCGHYIRKYNIYFADPLTQKFVLIDSLLSATDTSYRHANNANNTISLAGCYAVTAVDSAGNESPQSNQVCVDNCPCYRLPNVFTPNGDGHNDLYTPILPFRFVSKIEMKIFDRWGSQVFETSDPNINWNGDDQKSGKALPEDTYYYTCTLYEIRESGIQQNKNVLKGFIHLIRGNGGSEK